MPKKPSYEELEERIRELEQTESEHKRTEIQILESEERYKRIFESLQDVYYESGIDGTILEVSQSIEKLSQYTRKELIGTSLYDIYTDPKEREEFVKIVLDKGRVNDYEIHLKDKDGSQRLCSISTLLMRDNQGKPLKLIGSMRDISERKLFEEALRESEKKYQSLFNNAQVALFRTSIDGKLIEINKRYAEMAGYSNVEDCMADFNPRDAWADPQGRNELLKIIQKKGFVNDYETKIIRKDGIQIWILFSATVFPEQGFLEGSIVEITDRKQAEKALIAERNMLDTVTQNAGVGLAIISEDYRTIWANQVLTDIFGDVKDKLCYLTYNNQENICSGCGVREVFTNKKDLVTYEQVGEDINGKTIWSQIIATPIMDEKGNITSALEVVIPITERKKLEEQLRQSHKMESIGKLTGGIAHDFNNILGIIIGNAEIALDDIPEWSPVHLNLEEIKSAGLKASGIVKQLLSFSRKTAQELKPTVIRAVVEDTLNLLRSTIPATIEIRKNISAVDETILADPIQINQIIMNLCINASQEMEQTGGILEVTVENLTLDEETVINYKDMITGEYIKIDIIDTGPGIDPRIIDKIFDPYFTTKEIGKGTGMGLAVVQGIVKSHSGSITVDSKLGRGTAFSMLFPKITEKPEIEIKSKDELPCGTETILLVDDEKSIVGMTKQMLERLGYKVEAKTSPKETLELFCSKPDRFDLVITDMMMPQITGIKLSEQLMDIRSDIPVIICTGHSPLIDEEKAKEKGIAAYVMKPVMKHEIAKTIRKVLPEFCTLNQN
ncbi:MAG: PAS domain S-box protein [Pseudomonadota bacterium]